MEVVKGQTLGRKRKERQKNETRGETLAEWVYDVGRVVTRSEMEGNNKRSVLAVKRQWIGHPAGEVNCDR